METTTTDQTTTKPKIAGLENENGKYLKISSQGEISINAFRLLGASTKRDDETKIGFFGSGLKYAIAYLLRQGLKMKVYSGNKEIKFSTQTEKLGDKAFEVILINDVPTSMTTDLAVDWSDWAALRELHSNAIDEGGNSIDTCDEPLPIENYTVFYIEMNTAIRDIIRHWGQYFSEAREDVEYSLVRTGLLDEFLSDDQKIKNKIFKGGDELIIYRKGIQCFKTKKKCLFHYDMDFAEINESRVLKDMFDFKWELVGYLKKYATKEVVEFICKNMRDHWEGTLDWDSYAYEDFNDNWKEVLKGELLVPEEVAGHYQKQGVDMNEAIQVPNVLIKNLKSQFGNEIKAAGYQENVDKDFVILEKNDKHNFLLKEVFAFFDEVKYNVKYPVEVVEFKKSDVLGRAKDETIYIANKVFDMGRKEVANTASR